MASAGCIVCGIATNRVCGDCKSAAYCSSDCQTKDHHLHKLICGKITEFLDANPRPLGIFEFTYKLALLFPYYTSQEQERAGNPRLIWVKTKNVYDDDSKSEIALSDWYTEPPTATLHTRNDQVIEVWSILGNTIFPRNDNYSRNLNLEILVGCGNGRQFLLSQEAFAEEFGGAVIVMGVEKLATGFEHTDVNIYRDFSAGDLRVSVSCFLREAFCFEIDMDDLERAKAFYPYIIFEPPEWMKAVELGDTEGPSISKDIVLCGCVVNRNHDEVQNHNPHMYKDDCGVSRHMGIELLFVRHGVDDSYPYFYNRTAVNLLLNVDLSIGNEFWGRVEFPKYYNGSDPAFIVFRRDGQDITWQQVEALSSYCEMVLSAALEEPEGWEYTREDKKALLDVWCSAEKFGWYFEMFKKEKLAAGHNEWTHAVPPLGMRSFGHAIQYELDNLDNRNQSSPLPADPDDDIPEQRRRRVLAIAELQVDIAL